MCLRAEKSRTEKFQQKSGIVTVYKVYYKGPRSKPSLSAPHFSTLLNGCIKRPGMIISDRKTKEAEWFENKRLSKQRSGTVAFLNNGIHVYFNKNHAIEHAKNTLKGNLAVVVSLEADYSDLVGISHAPAKRSSHAVFMKVKLTEEGWSAVYPKRLRKPAKIDTKVKSKSVSKRNPKR